MTIFLELFEKSWGIPSRHRLVVSVLKWSNDWMIWGYTTIFGNPQICYHSIAVDVHFLGELV